MTGPETKTEMAAAATGAPAKKTLLDSPVAKFIFAAVSYAAPLPLLVALIQFWLDYVATTTQQNDVFIIFRQLFHGGGDPPWPLLPVALIPSLLILFILFRGRSARVLALACLPIAGLLEAIAFMQFFLT